MPRQLKLRLGDGTILAVDPQGLSTWLIDDKAMVQVGGGRRWRPLREVVAQARAAAAQRVASQPPPFEAEAAPPPLPLQPPPAPKPAPSPPVVARAKTAPAPKPVDELPIIPFKPLDDEPAVAWPAMVTRPAGAKPPAVVTPPVEPTPPPVVTPPAVVSPPAVVTRPLVVTPPAEPVAPPKAAELELGFDDDDQMPIIPFKPLDDPPPAPPPPAAVSRPKPNDDDGMPIIPFKPLVAEEEFLEELDLILEDDEEPAAPVVAETRAAPKGGTLLGAVSGWFQGLTRRAAPPPSLWGDDPPASWTARPRPAPLKPPPSVKELPSLRLAPVEKERAGDLYRGGGVAWPWIKRVVLLAGLAAGVIAAAVTWPVWTPKVTELSVLLFSQGQERPGAPPASGQGSAPPSASGTEQGLPPPLSAEAQAATERLPHLAPQTIQSVMATSELGVLAVPEVFRRAYDAAQRGTPALNAEEARELRTLQAAVLASLRPAERSRVRAYERMSGGHAMLTAEDDHVLALFTRGVRRLPARSRERLQALLGKAVAATLALPRAPRSP